MCAEHLVQARPHGAPQLIIEAYTAPLIPRSSNIRDIGAYYTLGDSRLVERFTEQYLSSVIEKQFSQHAIPFLLELCCHIYSQTPCQNTINTLIQIASYCSSYHYKQYAARKTCYCLYSGHPNGIMSGIFFRCPVSDLIHRIISEPLTPQGAISIHKNKNRPRIEQKLKNPTILSLAGMTIAGRGKLIRQERDKTA